MPNTRRLIELARKVAGSSRNSTDGPHPVVADSGNGGHLLYLVSLPNDDASTKLVKTVLEALAARFDRPDGFSPVESTGRSPIPTGLSNCTGPWSAKVTTLPIAPASAIPHPR